jgi:glycosyltransferase involved in cell wall biosynthesis
VFLESLVKLPSDLDWQADLVGVGSESDAFRGRLRTLGIERRVNLLGSLPNPFSAISSADIFVSPSNWETFGIVIIEAMALGKPVVATATAGTLDIITDGEDGVIVPIGDVEALAEAIGHLAKNPDDRTRLGQRAAQRSRDFEASAVAVMYSDLVKRAVHAST